MVGAGPVEYRDELMRPAAARHWTGTEAHPTTALDAR